MSDAMTAVLGAMVGGGRTVGRIEEDKRHDLAEKLKMELQNDLAMLRQKQQQGFQAGQQSNLFEHQTGLEAERRGVEQTRLDAQYNLQQEKERGLDRRASERNKTLTNIAGLKANAEITPDVSKSIETERKIVSDLVKSGWSTDEPMPAYYLGIINENRRANGRAEITPEQAKDKGFLSKFFEGVKGLFSSDTPEATVAPAAPADALQPAHGGQAAADVAAGTAADGSWRDTATAQAALNKTKGTAPVQSTDSTSVSPAGLMPAPTTAAPASTDLFEQGSFTKGPSDASKQAAMAEVTDLAKRVGNDYKKVWDLLSTGAKKAWGTYKVFADWFNKNTIGKAVSSQKQAYRETFQK